MRRNIDVRQLHHQKFADAVIQYTFARDRPFFLGIERGSIVFEILNKRTGLGAFKQNFGFAFVNLAAAGHGSYNLQN